MGTDQALESWDNYEAMVDGPEEAGAIESFVSWPA
jgi:hypothetical protein